MYKFVVFVPRTHGDQVREALANSGAGSIGPYDSGSFTSVGVGRFRPLEGANPSIGQVGLISEVDEERIETEVATTKIKNVIKAVREAHPYEYPAIQVSPMIDYMSFLEFPDNITEHNTNSLINNLPMSVVLEGLDGVGKSTISAILEQKLPNCIRLHTPPTSISPYRGWFDNKGGDIRKSFYMLGNFIIGDEMIKQKEKGYCVVIDRYYASTIAYSVGKRDTLPPEEDEVYMWPAELPKPDLSILLTLPNQVRVPRCAQRLDPETQEEASLRMSEVMSDNINEVYRRLGCREVSAVGSVNDVADRIIDIIHELQGEK